MTPRGYSGEIPPRATIFIDGVRYDWPTQTPKPWLAEMWELLTTKVPNPCIAQPYCCYMNTVIFYLKPNVIRPWHHLWNCNGKLQAQKPGSSFEDWGRVKTVMSWHSAVEVNGQRFEMTSGSVIWKRKCWWMLYGARRIANAA